MRTSARQSIKRLPRQDYERGKDGSVGVKLAGEIARRRGISRAEAARQAITETAVRERRRSGLAAEARRLMADDAYVKEALEVAELMEQLRGTR